jgi:hypothetical protein
VDVDKLSREARFGPVTVRYQPKHLTVPWCEETARVVTVGAEVLVLVGTKTVIARAPRGTPETSLWPEAWDNILKMTLSDIV